MLHMSVEPDSPLLSAVEAPAARAFNTSGGAAAVLVCEHASHFIPASLGTLGLSPEAERAHVAWDIGALDLSVELMGALDAPLVMSRISRLVYDCNRPPERADAIPAESEIFTIPGNAGLSDRQRAQRVREVYDPFRTLLSDTLDARPAPPVIVTIHSFTPVYHGKTREVELGILHDDDDRAAQILLRAAQGSGLKAALNEPYSAADGVTHTLHEHGTRRGLASVMIEVRNDLIDTGRGVNRIAGMLAPLLRTMITELAPTRDPVMTTGSGT